MVTHVVMWKLKDETENGTKQENALKIKEMLEALPEKIAEIKSMQVGVNENGGEYDAILLSKFASYEDLKAYDVHPEHQKVRAFIKEAAVSRAAVDFTE